MRPSKNKGPFENVGECLYRYKPSGVYYARIKKNGKEIRQSLEKIRVQGDDIAAPCVAQ